MSDLEKIQFVKNKLQELRPKVAGLGICIHILNQLEENIKNESLPNKKETH